MHALKAILLVIGATIPKHCAVLITEAEKNIEKNLSDCEQFALKIWWHLLHFLCYFVFPWKWGEVICTPEEELEIGCQYKNDTKKSKSLATSYKYFTSW